MTHIDEALLATADALENHQLESIECGEVDDPDALLDETVYLPVNPGTPQDIIEMAAKREV